MHVCVREYCGVVVQYVRLCVFDNSHFHQVNSLIFHPLIMQHTSISEMAMVVSKATSIGTVFPSHVGGDVTSLSTATSRR